MKKGSPLFVFGLCIMHVDAKDKAAMCNLIPMPGAERTTGCTRLVGSGFPEVTTFRSGTVQGFSIVRRGITALLERYLFQISSHTNRLAFSPLDSAE